MLVFRPPFLPNFQPLMSLRQRLVALMPADHPLAAARRSGSAIASAIRSRSPSAASAGGNCSPKCWRASNLRFDIVAESNSFEFLRGMVLRDKVISFQIEIGAVESDELVVRQIDDRDVPRRGPGARPIARAQSARAGREVCRTVGKGAGGDAIVAARRKAYWILRLHGRKFRP